jgi:raffinose/stachyose/melibiose transport system permease protein
MVPVHAVIIPVYDMAVKLGALNNLLYLSLIYSAFGLPFATFILYNFMWQIPHEIEESAIIDGCNEWKVFTRIILPLTCEGLISVSILTALNTWNDLLLPLILLNRENVKTVSIGLRTFFAEFYGDPTLLLAAGFISMLPVLLFYVILQEKVVKGLTMGAVKG